MRLNTTFFETLHEQRAATAVLIRAGCWGVVWSGINPARAPSRPDPGKVAGLNECRRGLNQFCCSPGEDKGVSGVVFFAFPEITTIDYCCAVDAGSPKIKHQAQGWAAALEAQQPPVGLSCTGYSMCVCVCYNSQIASTFRACLMCSPTIDRGGAIDRDPYVTG